MQLRFTKGVGVALAIAAGCAVLGFVMAPGWWFFSAFSFWLSFVFALGAKFEASRVTIDDRDTGSAFVSRDLDYSTDPSMRNSHAGNVTIDWDSLR